MQPEPFPRDDTLIRDVQSASAPLPANDGTPYEAVFGDVSKIIDAARESAARSVNAAMTAAYWLIGRRIVEFEQSGEERAEYGAALLPLTPLDRLRVSGNRGVSVHVCCGEEEQLH